MKNRRSGNDCLAGFLGTKKESGHYMPSKSDLLKVLDFLRNKEPPEIAQAKSVFEKSKRARRKFERSNATWMDLWRAEREAARQLQKAEWSKRAKWSREVSQCRALLRLDGVTPEVIGRIRRLVNGDGE